MFKNGLVVFKTSKRIEKKKRKKHPADKKMKSFQMKFNSPSKKSQSMSDLHICKSYNSDKIAY